MESHGREYLVSENFNSALKYQMSAVVAMIAARKVRVSLSDQSSLILQSLSQFNEKSNPGQPQPVYNSGKLYSITAEESEETSNSFEALPTFNSTITQPALMLTNPGGLTTYMYSNTPSDSFQESLTFTHTKITSDTAANRHALTRVKSSPQFTVLSSLLGSPQKESSKGSDITSQYIQRNHSYNDLFGISEYKAGVIDNTVNKSEVNDNPVNKSEINDNTVNKSEINDNTVNKAVIKSSSPLPSDAQKPKESNLSGTNSYGFGILSRTRQFGAWLTKATGGEKMEVTKKDLNALAPNTF